ncbi:MAG TPA: hypothetical protein DEB31_11110 [Clostridiales bacterium]|nr:hypothetical protein [Clostridiales bacterium]
MSPYDQKQPDHTAVERGVARQSLLRILIAALILTAVMVTVYFAFSTQQRRAQYHAYARQLYYDAMVYQAAHATGIWYDGQDGKYNYIRDEEKFPAFSHGGEIEVAFEKDGALSYAKWTRDGVGDLIDSLTPGEYLYAP